MVYGSVLAMGEWLIIILAIIGGFLIKDGNEIFK